MPNDFLMEDAPSRDQLLEEAQSGGEKSQEGGPDPQRQQAQADLSQYEEKLGELDKRLRDTQRWGNQEHTRAQQMEQQLQQLMYERQQIQDAYQRSQAYAEPQIDYEEALSDPAKMQNAFRTAMQYLEHRVHAAYGPMFQQNVQLATQVNKLRSSQTDANMELAKERWLDRGFDTSAFDSVERDLRGLIESGRIDANPDQIVQAGMLIADSQRVPFISRSQSPPPGVPDSPGGKSAVPFDLQRMYDSVQSRMGLPREKLSEADLEEMALDGGGR